MPFASRALIRERVIEGRNDLVQSRIRIDPFTGGTYPGALFEQQPLIGGDAARVSISFEVRNPTDAYLGLLLHILKDLWTGDLPLGGEASVGRGRLNGRKATLYWGGEKWVIEANGDGLKITGDPNTLEKTVQGLRTSPIVEVKDE